MLFKLIVILFLVIILYSLGSGLYYLVRNTEETDRVVKALTWRIALSIVLFVLILLAYSFGWIAPHGL